MSRTIVPILLLASALGSASPTSAQDAQRLAVGATLSITVEPDYRPGETGVLVNVLPLEVEWAFSDRVGLRLQSLVNLELSTGSFGHVGAGVALPIYLSDSWREGWYVGPYAAFAEVSELDGSDVTLAIEGGARWMLGDRFSLNLALHTGATHLRRPGDDESWVYHFGVFPSIRYWF